MFQGVPEDNGLEFVRVLRRIFESAGANLEAQAVAGMPGRGLVELDAVPFVSQRAQMIEHDASAAAHIEHWPQRDAAAQDACAASAEDPGQRFKNPVEAHVLPAVVGFRVPSADLGGGDGGPRPTQTALRAAQDLETGGALGFFVRGRAAAGARR